MTTIKSFTDLPQSKRLAKFLPFETADMSYIGEDNVLTVDYLSVKKEFDATKEVDIFPCWSLAALFDILPDDTNIIKDKSDTENEKYMCTVGVKGDIIPTFGKNPIDACVEMILRLHKLNLL